jgi:hypothetical protein
MVLGEVGCIDGAVVRDMLISAMEIPSYHKSPTPHQSASNYKSETLNVIWRNIQGEGPDRKLS